MKNITLTILLLWSPLSFAEPATYHAQYDCKSIDNSKSPQVATFFVSSEGLHYMVVEGNIFSYELKIRGKDASNKITRMSAEYGKSTQLLTQIKSIEGSITTRYSDSDQPLTQELNITKNYVSGKSEANKYKCTVLNN